jgi:hypothetical protein
MMIIAKAASPKAIDINHLTIFKIRLSSKDDTLAFPYIALLPNSTPKLHFQL